MYGCIVVSDVKLKDAAPLWEDAHRSVTGTEHIHEDMTICFQVNEAKRVLLQSTQMQGQEDGNVADAMSGLAI